MFNYLIILFRKTKRLEENSFIFVFIGEYKIMFKALSAIVFILSCVAAILVLSIFFTMYEATRPNDYAIVFDAGSSGTRMYLYGWKGDFSVARGDDLKMIEKKKCKVFIDLDTVKNESEIAEQFDSCIEQAMEVIPADRVHRTYIFLAATAGMRLLELVIILVENYSHFNIF